MPRFRVLGLVGLLALAGCSNLPTKPVESLDAEVGSGPTAFGASDPSSATLQPLALTTTRTINGLVGGTVRAGNFTVVIPPLAISGTAQVTVRQPDPAKPEVDLSIWPASANRFRLPVLLVADARPMDRSLLALSYISYWNPTTSRWERVPNSSVSLVNVTVTAPLWHFSRYRVEQGGKAGW